METNYYSKDKMTEGGFKKGKCKCGKYYAYCGADLGYCHYCLDDMEEKAKTSKRNLTEEEINDPQVTLNLKSRSVHNPNEVKE